MEIKRDVQKKKMDGKKENMEGREGRTERRAKNRNNPSSTGASSSHEPPVSPGLWVSRAAPRQLFCRRDFNEMF